MDRRDDTLTIDAAMVFRKQTCPHAAADEHQRDACFARREPVAAHRQLRRRPRHCEDM